MAERYPLTRCCVCGRPIRRAPHESYVVGFRDGPSGRERVHMCPDCHRGWRYGESWQSFAERVAKRS